MSLWDDAVNAVKSVYGSSQEAYDDLRQYLPGTIWVEGVPIPLKSSLDLVYGDGTQRGSVLEAYTILFGGARQTTPASAGVVSQSVAPHLTGDAMPQLIIANCFQVSIVANCGGRAVVNVVGVSNAAGSAAGAAAAVKHAWEIATGPITTLPSSYVMVNYHAVDIRTGTGAIVDLASSTAGSAGSAALATRAAAALVKWNGSSRSRSSRGRLYLGPLREAQIDSDGATISGANLTALNTAMTAFRNDLAAQSYPLVVLSRTLSQSFPVTTSAVEQTIATQRRRLRV